MKKLILATFLLAIVIEEPLCAEEAAASEQPVQLLEIESEVQKQEEQLLEINTQIAESERELAAIKLNLSSLADQERSIKSALEQSKSDKNRVIKEFEETEREINKISKQARARLKAIYIRHGISPANLALRVSSSGDSARNAFLMARIRAYENDLLYRLSELKQQALDQSAALDRIILEQEALKAKLQEKLSGIKKERGRQDSTLKSLTAQKKLLESSLAALRSQALRVETVVASLTSSLSEQSDPVPAKQEQSEVSKLTAPENEAESPEFIGTGLKSPARPLVAPVTGKLVRGFGKRKAAGFSDLVFEKGVELSSEPFSDVRAIGAARVMYVGRLPAYGNVVILDHGKRYYSLYGRVEQLTVEKGTVVEAGQVIAKTSAPDAQGRAIYFEIRENGKPVNPKNFFPKLGA
ncbi:MAG: hypothetical protein DCC75_03010 [Proteobacteria bacterium]|nr:MAG: hypothetical protein DCC75_03010 [Pseudomonadota bacterium]